MKIWTAQRRQFLPRRAPEMFPFFARAENLQQITPDWLDFRILDVSTPELRRGTLIRYALRWHGVPLRWTTEIVRWEPPHRFVDEQISGPYKLWHHEHRFVPQGSGTLMFDTVRYALPLGVLGNLIQRVAVGRDVEAIFDYRERRIREVFGWRSTGLSSAPVQVLHDAISCFRKATEL